MISKLINEWKTKELSDIAEVIDSLHRSPKYSEVGYPMIRVGDLVDGYFYIPKDNVRYVDKETYLDFSKSHEPKYGDILFSRVGTYGLTSLVKTKQKFCLGQNTVVITNFQDEIDNNFLYYYMHSNFIQNQVEQSVTGSTQQTISMKSIRELNVNYPCISKQKLIANMLSALDEKIENNNKINGNLEQQAQEIFKHWFVNFEFPDKNGMPYKSSGGEMIESKIGLIPDGWEVKSLIEIAEFLNGVAIAKHKPTKGTEDSLPAVKIRELRQGYTDQSSDQCLTSVDEKYIIDDFDMIFSWSGSLLIDIWVGDKAILNQHLFKVTSEEHDQWYYYYWTKYFLDEFIRIAQSKATTMGHINRSHLAEAKVLLPDASTYKEMGKTLGGILNLKMKNQKQNQILSELRDTLLPKLMSGELRIPLEE